jgi:membrane-bound lytic murein transglycosylase MltF
MIMRRRISGYFVALTSIVALCAGESSLAAQSAPPKAAPPTPAPPTASQPQAPPVKVGRKDWKGDLDGMIKRRVIRVATTYNKTHYFIDKGVQRGAVAESFELFEDELNAKLKTKNLRVNVVFLPVSRDELLPAVVQGRADIAAAALTVTPEREKIVDFSPSTYEPVDEIVVTGPGAPEITTLDDVAGQEVFVRRSSSFYESLTALNTRLMANGKEPVVIKLAPEELETEDILEMVNAGLVKVTVADNHIAAFWKEMLPAIVLHSDVAVRTGGRVAFAMRKDSPQLMAELSGWIERNGPRTLFGNMVLQRYAKSTKFVKSATSTGEMERFRQMVDIFRKYGDQYQLDYLLMLAQGFQESGLDHSVRSPVGAIGVMQVMPATGKDLKVGDIKRVENNIHAGVKYIRFMIDQYYKDEPMDPINRGLFAFASYNAGPARIRQLRGVAKLRGLDPNVWFNNVEQIASERIGRETVTYVSNIYKYYVAYRLAVEEIEQRRKLKQQ